MIKIIIFPVIAVLFFLFVAEVYAQESESISFQMDKSVYFAGDSIIISGKVSENYDEESVLFNLAPPHKNLNSGHKTTIDGHNEFYLVLNTNVNTADLWGGNGNYTIKARPGNAPVFYEVKTFEYYSNSSLKNLPTLKLSQRSIDNMEKKIGNWENRTDQLNLRIEIIEDKLEIQYERNNTSKITILEERLADRLALLVIFESLANDLAELIDANSSQ